MIQRDAETPADVRQRRRVDPPLAPRQLHRADEGLPGSRDAVPGATGMEDASVEWRVVSGDVLCTVDPRTESRPELAEGRRTAHVLPTESVDPGESEIRRRRPNQKRSRYFYLAFPAHDDAHRARAVPAVIGGLEINGDESTHAVKTRSRTIRLQQWPAALSPARAGVTFSPPCDQTAPTHSFLIFSFLFPRSPLLSFPSDLVGGSHIRPERRSHAGAGKAGLGGS